MVRLALVIIFVASAAHAAPQDLKNGLTVEEIQANAYMVTDTNYFASNTLVVKMGDDSVVIASSPYESVGTKTLIDWIKRTLQPKKMIAINTHFHSDGTGGNEVFKREGVEIWSSYKTQKFQKEDLRFVRRESLPHIKTHELKKRIMDTKIVFADRFFKLEDGLKLKLGKENVEVFFPGHAHSPDNVVVYFKNRKILFGGCIIKPKGTLGYLRNSSPSNWVRVTKRLLKFDADIVVPGHGKWGGRDLLTKTIRTATVAAREIARQMKANPMPPLKFRNATDRWPACLRDRWIPSEHYEAPLRASRKIR